MPGLPRLCILAATVVVLLAPEAGRAQTLVPAGVEFRIDETGAASTRTPSVAAGPDGRFVVTWYGAGYVFARTFDASGQPLQAPVRVDTPTSLGSGYSRVGRSALGKTLVVWSSGDLLYARFLSATGAPTGDPFRVSGAYTGAQYEFALSVGPDGRFVVAWASATRAIFAQAFDADGVAAGPTISVAPPQTGIDGGARTPAVAMLADGSFVVTWTYVTGATGARDDVMARRYSSTLSAAPAFGVNTFTLKNQNEPSVSVAPDGRSLITWTSYDTVFNQQDGSGSGIYSQLYAADGTRAVPEGRINTYTTDTQDQSAVAMAPDGSYTVVWSSAGQDGDGTGTYGQHLMADGTPTGSEFRSNTTTAGNQSRPSIATGGTQFIVVWLSGGGVWGQRYEMAPVASEPDVPGTGLSLGVQSPVGAAGGWIRYRLDGPQRVRLTLTDLLGREVTRLVDADEAGGSHEVRLNASALPSGTYVVRLDAFSAHASHLVAVIR